MNLEYIHLLPGQFSPQSRVWIYQSNRLFTLSEALELEEQINTFCGGWQAHGAGVKAWGSLLFGQFIVLMADETHVAVSGCSTDSSVRFIKHLEAHYRVNFFDRMLLAFFVKDKIQMLPLNQLQYAFENGFIAEETPFFNNLVLTKEELENNWIIPVKDSWLGHKIKKPA